LRDALTELRDPGTGALLVRDLLRADEIAPGPAPQDLADLHVVWNDTGPLDAASSARVGEVRVELPPMRPGNHVEGGWFVAAGPGIAHGAVDGAVSTLDFAPTVAHLVGDHFDCDGTPIAGITRLLEQLSGAKGAAEDGARAGVTPSLERPGDGSPAIPCG
jgi:hypothetical protein